MHSGEIMNEKFSKLKNNISFIYRNNPNTPRSALNFNLSLPSVDVPAGIYCLMVRLFMQGTKNRSSQKLSEELDKFAIEFSAELKLDYIKFKFVCLNEDFEKAVEIFTDIIKNSTFEEFEKERKKLEGEIIAELDSPRAKIIDSFYKNIYAGHSYGYTNTVILENLKNISKQDVINAYDKILQNSKKVIAFAGDLNYEYVNGVLEKHLSDLNKSFDELPELRKPILQKTVYDEIIKADLNQAHIIKGWLIDNNKDFPALSLLNIIMGASGLSSRLFLELRDKKGLAYVVRSSYDNARLASNFSIYIATEPKNIEVSLKGFEEEIQKIKNTAPDKEELENAVNNLFGKWAFVSETNSQQAHWLAHYEIIGAGYDFRDKISEAIRKITTEDIKNCANKYLTDKYVLSVLKP